MSNKQQLQINNTKVASLIETLRGKAVGSGGGDVEYETVNITENTTIIPFTLKRITATYGISTNHQSACGIRNLAHQNTSAISAYSAGGVYSFVRELSLSNASLSSGTEFFAPYVAIFVNDPSQEAIYEENT